MTQIKHIQAADGLDLLEPLVGKWHTEGEQLASPFGQPGPFVAVETFEWLEGGHFLVHRLDGRFGHQPAACIEVIGKSDSGGFEARTYYNDGKTSTWRLTAQPSSGLLLEGQWGMPSGAINVRCSLSFLDIGNTLESRWEHSSDGQQWSVFMTARATKAQPLPNSSVGG
jgi:hypothetical protein